MSRRSATAGASRFDGQAARFDERAGVPHGAAVDIAAAVLGGARPAGAEVVLELGAGTGEVGRHLAAGAGRYVGLDLSAPMLAVFGTKAAGAGVPLLVRADADRHWPVQDASVTVVFASRVAHLLDAEHVVAEGRRVCRPGGRFVVGRIDRTGVKQELRHRREALLAELGLARGRSGRRRTEALLDAFVAAGADREPARTVATWTVTTTVDEVIAGWEAMPTMGGETITAATRTALLGDLRQWAGEHLGDPEAPQETTEHYILEAVRLL